MKLLKALGALFVKLWRWIKETAWVQPLLIVGAIFALIFSIPYFTKWVEDLAGDQSTAYYAGYQITLNGQVLDNDPAKYTAVDEFTAYLEETSNLENDDTTIDNVDTSKYGKKFFVVYTSEECNSCNDIQPAFELLEDKWNTTYKVAEGETFRLHTIFTDEVSDTDDDDINENTAFQRYLEKWDNFYSLAEERLEESPYQYNAGLMESNDYKSFGEADKDAFPVPTILLVDYTQEAFDAGRPGISEVLFGVSGTTEYEKAELLLDMWNHFDTSDSTNKFTEAYKK